MPSTLWTQNSKIVLSNGKIATCDQCPCDIELNPDPGPCEILVPFCEIESFWPNCVTMAPINGWTFINPLKMYNILISDDRSVSQWVGYTLGKKEGDGAWTLTNLEDSGDVSFHDQTVYRLEFSYTITRTEFSETHLLEVFSNTWVGPYLPARNEFPFGVQAWKIAKFEKVVSSSLVCGTGGTITFGSSDRDPNFGLFFYEDQFSGTQEQKNTIPDFDGITITVPDGDGLCLLEPTCEGLFYPGGNSLRDFSDVLAGGPTDDNWWATGQRQNTSNDPQNNINAVASTSWTNTNGGFLGFGPQIQRMIPYDPSATWTWEFDLEVIDTRPSQVLIHNQFLAR